MKLSYSSEDQTILIDDNLKVQFNLLKFVFGINIINGSFQLYRFNEHKYSFLVWLWMLIIIVSLIVLYFILFKKTSKSQFKLSEIKAFKQGNIWNDMSLTLLLHNGKTRDLPKFSNKNEMESAKNIFQSHKIYQK